MESDVIWCLSVKITEWSNKFIILNFSGFFMGIFWLTKSEKYRIPEEVKSILCKT